MSPYVAYLCTIAIFVSVLAVGVSVANLLHFKKTEKKLVDLTPKKSSR